MCDSSDEEPFEDSGSEYQPLSTDDFERESLHSDEYLGDKAPATYAVCNQRTDLDDRACESPTESSSQTETNAILSRKRKPKIDQWKKNKRKKLRLSGKSYVNIKGKIIPQKKSAIRCETCRFKCTTAFTNEDVELIHKEFWRNTDNEKVFFYDKTTKRKMVQRKRCRGERIKTKKFSYQYYFYKGGNKIRVCKQFYLGVLSISQIRISYFHETKKQGITGTPVSDKRKGSKKRVEENIRQSVRDHINLFPRIPSHYCRKTTTRSYLERSLTLAKMYDMYCDYCKEKDVEPAKKWLYYQYYHIFNYEFNLSFQKPKKDLCGLCAHHDLKVKEGTLDENLEKTYRYHIAAKEASRKEKKQDVEKNANDETTAVVCFDMQSVLTCPQTNISTAYYKKKFAVYNLTGCDVTKKQGYCMLWTETLGGRKGADIASALYVMLEKISTYRPKVTNIILWSDSCISQNKNSHMSSALLYFLKNHPNIKTISQKFQEPGHSCVQEVDCMHSVLDRNLGKLELHSPLAILRAILHVKSRKPYKVVQMQEKNFLEFKQMALCLNLSQVPYKKIKEVSYTNNSNFVSFRLSFNSTDSQKICCAKETRSGKSRSFLEGLLSPAVQPLPPPIPADKVGHIKCLSHHFSKTDLECWKAIFKDF